MVLCAGVAYSLNLVTDWETIWHWAMENVSSSSRNKCMEAGGVPPAMPRSKVGLVAAP